MDLILEALAGFFSFEGLFWGGLGGAAYLGVLAFLKTFIKVSRPDKILVVTGRKNVKAGRRFGFSVERGRTLVLPYLQQVNTLDLEVLPINVRVEGVNSANGITVGADATACVCINDDEESMLYSAVERLMGKTREQIGEQLQATLVGNFRGALNKATPLQAIGMDEKNEDGTAVGGDRALFRNELLKDINSDLSHFGVKVVSVSLQKIWDTSNYIANLAQKTLARKRQEVEIQEARLRSKAEQAESDAERRITLGRNEAEEKILAARQKLELFQREAEGRIRQASLEADNGILEAENRGQQMVQQLMVELGRLKAQTEVTLRAQAEQGAAVLKSEGEAEAARLVEGARNEILSQKAELLARSPSGALVVFLQQQLPDLAKAFLAGAQQQSVDQMVLLEDPDGFNKAVNRGPAAFVDYLRQIQDAYGVDIRSFFEVQGGRA